jgi:hypothetical protein
MDEMPLIRAFFLLPESWLSGFREISVPEAEGLNVFRTLMGMFL